MSTAQPTPPSDLLTGYAAIGAHLGWSPRTTRHHVDRGHLPIVRIGQTPCARRSSLDRWLSAMEAEAIQGQERRP